MGLLSWLSPASLAGPIAGAVGNFLVKELFHELSKVIESLVASVVNDVLNTVVRQTTAVTQKEGNSWFAHEVGTMAAVGELVVAPLLMVATIGAILRQDLRRLGRAWAVGLPVAALGGLGAMELARVGMKATDGLTAAVLAAAAPHLKADFVGAVSVGLVPGISGGVGALLSIVVLAGALLVWVELAVRSLAVEVAVFFMPLALAGLVWPSTAHWAKRFVEMLAALLLVKPIIAGVLGLGTAALTARHPNVGSVVQGAALLLLAAFAPLVVLKMAPLVELASVAHLHELARAPVQAVQSAMSRAASAGAGTPAAAGASGGGEAGVGLAATLLRQTGDHPLGPARPLGTIRPTSGEDPGTSGGSRLGEGGG